ncbi:hypothetical protein WJX74_004849 [Apatococcus lobatus]|uniref:Multiple inositol polyphosphate phosphatase 1 n=1 Tax=Apatococcus lobatus TaxID=904363 RepID=A0AAW1RAY6_9CHLO
MTVQNFLSSRTPYAFADCPPQARSIYTTPDPAGYEPQLLYQVTRHGTRMPTAKRIRQMAKLENLLPQSRSPEHQWWIRNWTATFDELDAGYLHAVGEIEMQKMGQRLRDRFPHIFGPTYHPRQHAVISTQVPRASASASAFAQGAWPCAAEGPSSGNTTTSDLTYQLQPFESLCRPQPVALTMMPKEADPLLRFFKLSPAYTAYLGSVRQPLRAFRDRELRAVAEQLTHTLDIPGRNVGPDDAAALWQLCQWQAALSGITDQACSLFSPEEIEHLEWVSDVELFVKKGYAVPEAFCMARPLLQDLSSAFQAISRGETALPKARLHFAHAETLLPLTSLLGLFGAPGAMPCTASRTNCHTDSMTGEEASDDTCPTDGLEGTAWPDTWPIFPRPPATRIWHGNMIVPFGANLAFLLYRPINNAAGRPPLVFTIYNEHYIPLPGCAHDYCELKEFLAILEPKSKGVTAAEVQ